MLRFLACTSRPHDKRLAQRVLLGATLLLLPGFGVLAVQHGRRQTQWVDLGPTQSAGCD